MSEFHTNRSRLPADVCEHLCTKTMYTGGEDRRQVEEWPGGQFRPASFWCVFTQRPWGPDEDLVGPEECRPGRACCVPRISV